jgi:hypothetical protein
MASFLDKVAAVRDALGLECGLSPPQVVVDANVLMGNRVCGQHVCYASRRKNTQPQLYFCSNPNFPYTIFDQIASKTVVSWAGRAGRGQVS